MGRLFQEHIRRKTQSLDGMWRFSTDPGDVGEIEKWYQQLPNAELVAVPSVWNTQLGLLEYEGAAWYEKRFYSDGGCLRLCFGGVMTLADVWLDGAKVGSHYGGFCQFDFIVPQTDPGWHTLTVRADNRYDALSIPQEKTDWYHYGGITRGVSVEQLEGICILHDRLIYDLSQDLHSAKACFELELYNAEKCRASTNVKVCLDGVPVFSDAVTVDGNTRITITTPAFAVDQIRLWDTGKPELYEICCITDTDDLIDRTGFRWVEVCDGQVYLNGRPLQLRGINRHEEHPDWGMAFPVGLMKRDLDIIADMGCNALRGSHYPNAPVFVDMLDSRGITFWSEIPMWGGGFAGDALTEALKERGLQMHQEMVKYYYNHPSILIWGMHNEIDTAGEPARELTRKYYRFLKEHGGNRLVTYATNRPMKDICMELCDIICINRYVGWYGGHRSQWQEDLDAFRARWQELGLADKPVIYSEFGGAAIYGHHTFDDLRGTEEYQARLLEICLNAFHNDPMVAGTYIWQFCDIRTCRQMGLDRARSYNNKGILNEYRRPKQAYHTVKRLYHAFAAEEAR